MLEIHCSGSPWQIGYAHGHGAQSQVQGSMAFYSKLFAERCSMDWSEVTREASKYVHPLKKTCSRYLEEIQGLAEGAGVGFLDVLALNVRTEITFGLFSDPNGARNHADVPSDGCTSLGWVDGGSGQSFLAQNWDWQRAQGPNLVVCHISQPGVPRLSMVTEGGIVGKIGLNERGVGCCLNAIRARGVDPTKLPVHFALRTVLESGSREEAISRLKAAGIAGSAHILVGDDSGSTGLECTPLGIKELSMDSSKRVFHTNHLILEHPGVDEPHWLDDSPKRLARIQALADDTPARKLDFQELARMLRDEEGGPCSINRRQEGESGFQTLFTIIMNLGKREAWVKFGRPTEHGEELQLSLES